MHLLDTYLPRKEFDNYEDFAENFKLNIPKGFNFAFDIVDKWAETQPDKLALVYEDDFGTSKQFTFKEISEMSNRAANYFTTIGIKKGDVVMLTLKRRYQFWYIIIALHKIGAISVPATEMLKAKDFEYRFNAADVKMIISVGTEDVLAEIDEAEERTHKLIKAHEGDTVREGWVNIDEMIGVFSPYYDKGTDYPCDDDRMLMYFTSGTTGNPKIVTHNYTYPLGHITTAYYWHNCVDNGLHLSVAETGWAKCAWGK
ncbi:MAG: acetyl-CoA synthetase, partial [Anaerofustis stercorihominis]|nr:acetyl-CoA synthetase [Anaerofustis stercorihominis]